MRPRKDRKPFTLFKKETGGGSVWYARFWDEITRRYAVARSLGVVAEGKKGRRYEAEQAARKMLPGIRFERVEEKSLIRYLEDFWTPDSPYAREAALVKKRPLSAYYVKMNHEDVRRHVASFPKFTGITPGELTPALIRDWLTWLAGKGLSGGRINHVLQGMRVAIRYAVAREELPRGYRGRAYTHPQQLGKRGRPESPEMQGRGDPPKPKDGSPAFVHRKNTEKPPAP